MGKKVIVAPVSENMNPLFVSLKEFSTERIHLISTDKDAVHAERAKSDLEKFNIPVKIHIIKGNIWEEIFRIVGEVASFENKFEVIVNVAIGDFNSRCAATCAAFVNGLKAFSVDDDQKLFLLPVLKFSYYSLLTDKKMQILKLLGEEKETSFEELSKKTKMSLPLVSYHINGNLKSEGLKKLGLIETKDNKGKTMISLTTLGRMLLKGYIGPAEA
ncbi:MAG: ArsR family transcriptional regulator [Candidatus Woesearchaeota archaeon]